MRYTYLAIPLLLTVAACNRPRPGQEGSDAITHAQLWQREDQNSARERADMLADRDYMQANGGYSGSFACHTPDGGCLHMTCDTKKSCDYMVENEKRCGTPAMSTDPKVLDRLVVKDDSCPSVQKDQSTAVVTNSPGYVLSNNGTLTYTVGAATATTGGTSN